MCCAAARADVQSARHTPYGPMPSLPTLKPQAIPFDHPDSNCLFLRGPHKPFLATAAAIAMYSHETIIACWRVLCTEADEHSGLDAFQVFEDPNKRMALWFVEDTSTGAITALLPADYWSGAVKIAWRHQSR